jgi:hypothetical protein
MAIQSPGDLFYLNDYPFVIIRQIEDIEKVHPALRNLGDRVKLL